MIFIGIDPGQTGGVCFLDSQGSVRRLIVMPTIQTLADELEHFKNAGNLFACVEKAQAFPKQGVSSVFSYGYHAGTLEGVLVSLKIPFELVPPKTWSKVVCSGVKADLESKQRSYEAARRLFPGLSLKATDRCSKPHMGIVEALLIAEYARRKGK